MKHFNLQRTNSKSTWFKLIQTLLPALLLLALEFFIFKTQAVSAAGSRYYVKHDATGSASGLDWTNAFTNVQSALNVASNGDEIWVAAGIYTPTNTTGQSASFILKSGVAIYGGFAGDEEALSERDLLNNYSVLSGDLDGNDTTDIHGVLTSTNGIVGTNAYHVVTASGSSITETAVLDGFYITGGNAVGSDPHNGGGGLWIGNSASPVLNHLWINGNYGVYCGGGALIGGYSQVSLSNSVFAGNRAGLEGGAMRIITYAEPTLVNVLISGNWADSRAGAISAHDGDTTMVNVTIASNYAVIDRGGINNYSSYITMINSIVWGNNSSQLYDNGGGAVYDVTYSDIQGGYSGTGNLSADPLFSDPINPSLAPTSLGNYRLKEKSPGIDSGNSSAITEIFDLDNKDRFVDGDNNGSDVVDMGAYEWQRYMLNIIIVGNGSIVKNPNRTAFTTNDSVVITATADSDWNFAGWSGDIVSSDNPLHITMEDTTTLTATFTTETFPLTINVIGQGNVAKNPDLSSYPSGSAVTLTATADPGWSFVGWTGDIISNANPLLTTIQSTTTLTATFSQNAYLLTVNITGEGAVTKTPDLSSYPYGTVVTLTAIADPGWFFAGWSGDQNSSQNPLVMTITSDMEIFATFNTYLVYLPSIIH